jgi:Tripartite tricarboxylate transporter TctB family
VPATIRTEAERGGAAPSSGRIDTGAVVVSTLLLIVAAAALWESRQFSSFGAIFPRTIAAVQLVAGAIVLWRALRRRSAPTRGLRSDGLLRGLLLIAVMSIWIVLLERTGFVAAGVLAYVALALVTERERITFGRVLRFLAVAVVFVAGFQLLFVRVLKVQLPGGALF